MDAKLALIQAHDDSIRRYQRLLETRLTDLEREYIEGRLSAERSILQSILEPQGELNSLQAYHGILDWSS